MKIYICGNCKFTFERSGEVEACPDCGRMNVQLADEKVKKEYHRIRAEMESERRKPQEQRP